MLLIAGTWSLYELRNVGASVQKLLNENYKSVDAAKSMLEALEREDSAVLLLLLGKKDEGRTILQSADASFMEAYATASHNITIQGENDYVAAVKKAYDEYRALWSKPIAETAHEGNLNWYLQEVHLSFFAAKQSVQNLMSLNDRAMYQMASDLEGRAHRATMPGIIAIASAFIFSIIFSYFINLYVVNPVINLTRGIQQYLDSGKPLDVKVESNDELAKLVSSVGDLISTSKR